MMNLSAIFKAVQVGASVYSWYHKAKADDKISRDEMADAVTEGLARVNLGSKLERDGVEHALTVATTKEGVSLRSIKGEIQLALTICELHYSIFRKPCVVTSAREGTHGSNSLHYKDLAIDLRTRDLPKRDQVIIANRIKVTLEQVSPHYDVVLEHDHLHIEFDVK